MLKNKIPQALALPQSLDLLFTELSHYYAITELSHLLYIHSPKKLPAAKEVTDIWCFAISQNIEVCS